MREIEHAGTGRVFHAPMDVELNEVSIVQPDIIVVAGSRREIIAPSRIIGVPDLLVEILSPANPTQDTKLKLNLYEQVGVPEYWIVFPDARVVRRYILSGSRYDEGAVYDTSIEYSAGDMHVTIDLAEVWRRAEV